MKTTLVACLTLWLFTVSVVHAQKPELVVPIGHTGLVDAITFSPDGKYALSGSDDYSLKLWELSSGKLLRSFKGHTYFVRSVAFSPDGNYALSGSWDGTLKLWEIHSGRLLRTFAGHTDKVASVTFSPNGRYVLSGSWDSTLKLWEVTSGKLVRSFKGHKDFVRSVAFSPDGNYALSGSDDKTLKLWEVTSGKLVRSFKGHKKAIYSVVFSPNGRYALSGGDDEAFKLWGVNSGKLVRNFQGKVRLCMAISFTPDGRFALSGEYGEVAKWEVNSGELVQTFERHRDNIITSLAISPNGRFALSSGMDDRTIELWEVNSGKLVRSMRGYTDKISSVAFSPDSRFVLSGSKDNTLKLWELSSGQLIHNFKGHKIGVNSVTFSPDSRLALSGSWDKTLKLWEISSGKLLRTFEGHTYWVNSVAFSPDGQYALSGSDDKTLKLWEIRTSKLIRNFPGHTDKVNSVAFSPDGQYALSGSDDKTLKLWDTNSGKLLQNFEGHTDKVKTVSFSPNGKYVVSGSLEEIKLWELNSGNLVLNLKDQFIVESVLISPDNHYILSGSWDGMLKLWEIPSGRLLRTFEGHTNPVSSVAFSPDGRFIVSGSDDNTTKIWNTATGKEIATLISVDSTDWIVTTPTGLFDASSGAMKLMHYVVNDSTDHDEPWKVIELEQLKQRYYQPGLLPILMDFKNEPLRQVPAFEGVALPPNVQIAMQTDTLVVSLKNNKGGIGQVEVFFNGAKVVKDLRVNPAQDSTQTTHSLRLPLTQFANRFDTLNKITVLAYNGAGWLSSRPQTIAFRPATKRRGAKVEEAGADSVVRDVRLRAVLVGTSNVGLRFAHKDAEQVAQSLSLIASSLLGADKTSVQLLTTQDGTNQQAKKADIVRALVEAQQTRPQDVFVLYLSGHGVNYGGQDGDFYYLTAGATSADAGYLNDPGIRQTYALSSEELTDLLNQIPARKKLLILDVCAAGKGAERLVLAARDIPASQIRAMDKLQSRTGFYVLAGSAADAVSYESNVYGQGLLTYSLLQGIRGAALRREGQEYYVDVEKLLNYTIETVPALAKEVRGIQQPFYRAASEQRTFDIGRVTDSIRRQIPLAEPKRMLLIRSFQEETQFDDVLKLKNRIEGTLTDLQARGTDTPFLLMEAEDYPNAYSLTGRYKLMGERVTVVCKLFRSGVPVDEFIVQGEKGKLSELTQKIVTTAQGRLKH